MGTLDPEIKPGFKTTEFWMVILTMIGSVATSVAGIIPAKWAAVASAVAGAAYAISRGMAKK